MCVCARARACVWVCVAPSTSRFNSNKQYIYIKMVYCLPPSCSSSHSPLEGLRREKRGRERREREDEGGREESGRTKGLGENEKERRVEKMRKRRVVMARVKEWEGLE